MNKGTVVLVGIIVVLAGIIAVFGIGYILSDDVKKPFVYDAEAEYERLVGDREGGVIVTKDKIVMPSDD